MTIGSHFGLCCVCHKYLQKEPQSKTSIWLYFMEKVSSLLCQLLTSGKLAHLKDFVQPLLLIIRYFLCGISHTECEISYNMTSAVFLPDKKGPEWTKYMNNPSICWQFLCQHTADSSNFKIVHTMVGVTK